LKKWLACSLILLASGLVGLAFSQAGAGRDKTPPAEALRAKREGVAAGVERRRRLMSSAGVLVDESALLVPGGSIRTLKISWNDPARKGSKPETLRAGVLSSPVTSTVAGEARGKGSLARQRSLELSPEHVLLATVDARSRLRWSALIPDPRILRSELPGDDGLLEGVRLYQPGADFVVHIPEDPEATELRFYHPLPSGEEFTLQLLSTVALRGK
jgi:hypothetical protein